MTITIKDTGKWSTVKPRARVIYVWRNDGSVEDLAAGEVGVQVDVGGQDEVLVVVLGGLAQQHQVFCRSDLVRVIRVSGTAAVFGVGRQYEQARNQG
jgi:hypothetical protein